MEFSKRKYNEKDPPRSSPKMKRTESPAGQSSSSTDETDAKQKRSRDRNRRSLQTALLQIEDAIDREIVKLRACKGNMIQLRRQRREDEIDAEQMEASNHMNQIKNLVKQVSNLSQRIIDEGLMEDFEQRLDSLQNKVNQELTLFSKDVDLTEGDQTESSEGEDSRMENKRETRSFERQKQTSSNLTLEAEVVSKRRLLRSWKDLQRDLSDLNDMIKKFSSIVWTHRETVDRIEDNVTNAQENLNKGAVTLSKITKNAALPLIGAGVGAAVAGPLGLFLGYKLAAVACIGTASAGYFGGKAVQKITTPPVLMIDNKDKELKEVPTRKQDLTRDEQEGQDVAEEAKEDTGNKKKKKRLRDTS